MFDVILKLKFFRFVSVVGLIFLTVIWGGWVLMFWMPEKSYQGSPVPVSKFEGSLRERLKNHVIKLADTIGERNLHHRPKNLMEAKNYIQNQFETIGYDVQSQDYRIQSKTVQNIYVQTKNKIDNAELVVVGAHYDTVRGSPGANDNATGVAALIELARVFHQKQFDRPILFVAFANEEPPYFMTDDMGSYQFANFLKQNQIDVKVMVSLETIGYFSNKPNSQNHIFPLQYFYPNQGNFITFVGNVWRGGIVRDAIGAFRRTTKFPSEGITAPSFIPGISWSDHQSFWKFNYPGLMVTDTAPYRYPFYHTSQDTPDKISYVDFTKVTSGMMDVVEYFASDSNGN